MATYNSFIFEGHGTSERTGGYDPGATSGSIKENDLADKIVTAAMNYLKSTGLSIHRDENNFTDNDLAGNSYTAKAGISVHINAGGGTGTEIYVPAKEKFLTEDFNLVKNISGELGIPNRGVKSRDYNSGSTYTRSDGVALAFTDYYKEIRDAWSLGISLAIIEVGFIDTSDLQKIQNNIDDIGFFIAKYIAKLCDVELSKPEAPKPVEKPVDNTTTADVYYRVVCGSFKARENAETRKKELEAKGYSGVFIDIYRP